MKHKKNASVLVYTLILVVISVFMALAILSIASILESNIQLQNIVRALASNVISKGNLSIKYGQVLNSNGTGFIDVIGCPSSVTMSGTTQRTVSATTLRYQSGKYYCLGSHSATPFYIYFNTGATDFSLAEYAGSTVFLSGKVGITSFSNSDATNINFSSYVNAPDSIDDGFNSDNYLGTSTGNTLYPDNYQDDDANARKTLFGYASSDVGFVNMLWDNKKIEKVIKDNVNNTGSLNYRLGEVTAGKLYIDVNKNFRMRLYRLDKTLYETTGELTFLNKYESTDIAGGVGYLEQSAGVLSLSPIPTGNTYSFDFQNNDYALFIRNNSTGALLYTIKAEGTTGSGIYINPIRDDQGNTVTVLGNDIIIDNTGRFIYEQFEVIGFK